MYSIMICPFLNDKYVKMVGMTCFASPSDDHQVGRFLDRLVLIGRGAGRGTVNLTAVQKVF